MKEGILKQKENHSNIDIKFYLNCEKDVYFRLNLSVYFSRYYDKVQKIEYAGLECYLYLN